MIDKLNNLIKPNIQEIKEYVTVNTEFIEQFCNYLESYNPKVAIEYSKCSAAPGWNLKYKSKGKTICILYPYPTHFTALITLNADYCTKFNTLKSEFSKSTQLQVQNAKPCNGTKWIMLDVMDKNTLSDAIKLIALKCE